MKLAIGIIVKPYCRDCSLSHSPSLYEDSQRRFLSFLKNYSFLAVLGLGCGARA